MKKFNLVLFFMLMSIGWMIAQTKVSGIVISADDGEPIIGASVIAAGTTVGIVTDIDGKFTLDVPKNTTQLKVTYVGMKPVEVGVKPNLRIVMHSDTKNLDEVVVLAMGMSKEKKSLGYAVQDVSSEQLTQASNTSLAGALQGKLSGVDIKASSGMPGASSQIVIRGARSFTGDNTPLYVVDGMPIASTADISTGNSVSGSDYANRAFDIDPNDIETINILKGQAASALYGIRASNGVVVITTKSGKGLQKGKPQITVNSSVSFDKISRKPKIQNVYAQGTGGAYSPLSSMSWGPKITDLPNDPKYGGNTKNKYTDEFGMQEGMYFVQQRANAGLNPWARPQVYDNIGNFFDTGVTWNNSVNVAQARDNSSFSITLGAANQSGIIPKTGMDRYNAKVTAETLLANNWTAGFAANYVNSKIDKSTSANDGIVATVYPAPPSYDLGGIPSHYENDLYAQNTYRGTGGFDAAYWSINNNKFTEKTHRVFGNTYVNYKTKFNTENQTLNVKYQIGVDSYTTNYSDIWGYGHQNGKGSITNSSYTATAFNSLLTASYNWIINDDWNFDALLGNEVVHDGNRYVEQYGSTFNFPGWNHINNTVTKDNSESQSSQRTVGFFANIGASYRNMLYLNVTGRNDYVSTMPRKNRSFFYPSVSAGFVFSELDFVNKEILNFGKLRASYAEVGQAGRYYNNYYVTPGYGGGFYSMTPLMYPIAGQNAFVESSTVYDPNLKPQNTISYEVGVDLNFLNNLIEFSYTFSRQNVKDQIFAVPLAASTGSGSFMTNGGKIHTNSHELNLTLNPVRTTNVQWSIGANWSKIDNYVDELAPGVESIFLGGFVTPQVRAGIGDKFPVIYGVAYKRDDQGRILVNEDGIPEAGAPGVIGRVSPKFLMGFNTSLTVYKFNVSAVFDWKNGGQMYCGTNGLLDLYGVSTNTLNREGTTIFDGWNADGTKNTTPITGVVEHQNYYNDLNNIDESSVYDNSFLKLRELAISYPVVQNNFMELRVNAFARNILIWSKLKNLDPESTQGNNNMAGSFERFSLPATSSYGLGINVKF